MLPLRDTIPTRKFPVVNWALIIINFLIFLYQIGLPPEVLEKFILQFALVPKNYTQGGFLGASGLDLWHYLPFLSSMFMHGGWGHLLGNMLTLYIFGDNIEDRMGRVSYLLFYVLSGFAAGCTHILLNIHSPIPVLGASGAISGVMGAYMLLYPSSRILMVFPIVIIPVFFHIRALYYLGFWFLLQLYYGYQDLAAPGTESGVAFFAHAGGFLGGVILYRLFLDPYYAQKDRDRIYRKYPHHVDYDSSRRFYRDGWR